MSDQPTAVLCLGSNVPDRERIISRVLVRLENFCSVEAASSIYEAPDESGIGESYINIVLSVSPRLSYGDFTACLKQMEIDYGRTPQSKSEGKMPLDIDIIIWNGQVVDRYQYSRPYFQRGYKQL